MTEIIFYGTPKRASTVQMRVRSTESYALVRSIQHTYSGIGFFRASSCNRRITNIKYHIGGRTARSETILFFRQDPHALAILAKTASDDLQQYLAGVRYQRDAPAVAAFCPILLFMEYHDDGIFPLLWHLAAPPNTNGDTEQSPVQGGITVE